MHLTSASKMCCCRVCMWYIVYLCIFPLHIYIWRLARETWSEGRESESCTVRLRHIGCFIFKEENIWKVTIYFKNLILLLTFFFLKIFFRERGREGEKHQCVVASCVPPTGGQAHNPGMCPDWELNQQPFGSQACAQSIELHQPGLTF